jgi:hypothetical protein
MGRSTAEEPNIQEPLAKPLRPAWKPALHCQQSAIVMDSWRVGFHPDRLSGSFASGSQVNIPVFHWKLGVEGWMFNYFVDEALAEPLASPAGGGRHKGFCK